MLISVIIAVICYFGIGIYALIWAARHMHDRYQDGPRFIGTLFFWPIVLTCCLLEMITTDLPIWINKRATLKDATTEESDRTKPA